MSDQRSAGESLTVLDALPVHPGDAPDPASWRLRVDGLVGQPLDLGLHDLLAMTQQLVVDDFACLEGWTVPGIRWRGIAVADLLERAGAPPDAAWVQVTADDFSVPLPVRGRPRGAPRSRGERPGAARRARWSRATGRARW